jgi:flagellar basal body-associated protein FliL
MFALLIVGLVLLLVASTIGLLLFIKKAHKKKEKIKLFKEMGYDKIGYA